MSKLKFGVIGCGQRGKPLTEILVRIDDIEVTAVCDTYLDKAETTGEVVEKAYGKKPLITTDYKQVFSSGVEAVLISTSWEEHIPMAIEAMKRHIACAIEVGGAYNVEECFDLVKTYEETKTPIMLMENCCYNKEELLITSMARAGMFGTIVHCEGAYAHDLRSEVIEGEERRHYRLRNYINRNCENYPTHELGPIAKLLDINRGNRMVSLVSVASREAGLTAYIDDHKDTVNQKLIGQKFKQGDIVSTLITCENGETISLRLDTSLPRHYNRNFTVHGTKGLYEMGCNMVFLDGMKEEFDTAKFYAEQINNAKQYEEKFLPDIWKNITEEQIKAGHGGMDELIYRDFVRCVIEGHEMPIDVYDTAAWMVITTLTEKSIAEGGTIQMIPDFTNGKWKERKSKDVTELRHE